ncbi:GTP-binding protein Di-Ras2 [Fragariocoptes setiger]|uniref:GTP-binding protein Di-Ras2 n=1 Tax=Fragariocoptes setiger TaxID=1670756 RepID=A0ABQ7S5N3_9ACAR|nr:GTP-binding protein Di-Ras2 [Fragariocoptes setiger]
MMKMSPDSEEKLHFRLVLLGSVGTGFLFQKYVEKHKPTVEDLFTKDFDLGTIVLRVHFLDTSGSMQFPAMRRLSITTGSAFLIVYSVEDETSFEIAKQCIEEIQEVRSDYQEIPIIFAGNKSDLPPELKAVKKEDVCNYVFCELPRLRVKVLECSCKNDVNINEIFKAYLTLARISLSSAVDGLKRRSSAHASSKWRLGSRNDLGECNNHDKNDSNNDLSASSPITSRDARRTITTNTITITTKQQQQQQQQSPNQELEQQRCSSPVTKTSPTDSSKAHLSLMQRVKPRSRSLMRRSTRKPKVKDDVVNCAPS